LPMLDQVAEQLGAPADPAFEERKAQIREAPGDAAEEQTLRHRVPGGGEMADMIEGEVGGVVAQPEAAAAGVEGWRDLQLAAFLPDLVVVVLAVETELVVEHSMAAELQIEFLGAGQRAGDAAAEHAHLGAELRGDEF